MLVIIREANEDDIPILCELTNEMGYKTSCEEMINRFHDINVHADYKTYVASIDKGVVGMAGAIRQYFYEQNGIYVRLAALVTLKEYRNKGVATALVKEVEQWARDIGASAIYLNSGNREERKSAHEFYLKRGFLARSTGFVKKLL